MGDIWKTAVRSLWRKRLRTLLTMCGIVIGIMLITIVTVIGDVGKSTVDRELENMGLGGLSVTTSGDAVLAQTELTALRSLSSITSASPLMLNSSRITFRDGSEEAMMACGIDSGEAQAIGLSLQYGRLLSEHDVAAGTRVCVLDAAMAERLFCRQNVVGQTVTFPIDGVPETFTVVGVTEAGSSLLQNVARWMPGLIYIPYTTMQQLTGREDFDQVAVRLREDDPDGTAAEEICEVLARVSGSDGFTAENLAAQKDRLSRLMDVVTWILTAISGISLLVSGLSIMTIMVVSVGERTREIGIKKALGASCRHIRREFLAESLLLSVCGGGIGVLIGGGISVLGASLFGVCAGVPLWLSAAMIAFAAVIGVLFGVYPASKAASLDPVDALRSE